MLALRAFKNSFVINLPDLNQFYSGEVNIALRKPTKQSSNIYGRSRDNSYKAVDGNDSPLWQDGSCTHTDAAKSMSLLSY